MTSSALPRRVRLVTIAFVVSAAIVAPAGAQAPAITAHGSTAVRTIAQRRTSPVVIDGRLDEAAWREAMPVTAFRQYQPSEGAPASLPTEIRILFDDQAIYIGARMSDPLGVAGVRAPRARRDQLLDGNGNNGAFNPLTSDKLIVVLDPYHNHLDQALFEINPAGVRGESFNGCLLYTSPSPRD